MIGTKHGKKDGLFEEESYIQSDDPSQWLEESEE